MDRRSFFKALAALAIPGSLIAKPAAATTATLTNCAGWNDTPISIDIGDTAQSYGHRQETVQYTGDGANQWRRIESNNGSVIYYGDGRSPKPLHPTARQLIEDILAIDYDDAPIHFRFSGNTYR